MTPTPKLRFVERSVPLHPFYKTVDADGNLVQATQTYRVLQQWWDFETFAGEGEWRDITLEKEE